jgi:hypothetical protein
MYPGSYNPSSGLTYKGTVTSDGSVYNVRHFIVLSALYFDRCTPTDLRGHAHKRSFNPGHSYVPPVLVHPPEQAHERDDYDREPLQRMAQPRTSYRHIQRADCRARGRERQWPGDGYGLNGTGGIGSVSIILLLWFTRR